MSQALEAFKAHSAYPRNMLDASSWQILARRRKKSNLFYITLGSAVAEPYEDAAADFLYWCHVNLRQGWCWGVRFEDQREDSEIVDVKFQVWIRIDSVSDAVLARMTWLDLRSEHALH